MGSGVGTAVDSGVVMGHTVWVGRGTEGFGVGVDVSTGGFGVGVGGGTSVFGAAIGVTVRTGVGVDTGDAEAGLADRGSSTPTEVSGSMFALDTGFAVGSGAVVDSAVGTKTAPQATVADINTPSINETRPRFMVASSAPSKPSG